MEKPLYAWTRVQRLKSFASVASASKHGRRTGKGVDHVDRSVTPDNRAFSLYSDDPFDVVIAVRRAAECQHATFRRSASPAMHLLIHLSPEWFIPTAPGERFDNEKVDIYWREALAWLTKEFGPAFAAARMDLDESTPHVDAFIVPVSSRLTKSGRRKREVSVRDRFGTKRSLESLQTSFANQMKKYGFKRGKPKKETGHVNRPFRNFHMEVSEREKKVELREKAIDIAMAVITHSQFRIEESIYVEGRSIILHEGIIDREAVQLLADAINADRNLGLIFTKMALASVGKHESSADLENIKIEAFVESENDVEQALDPSSDPSLLDVLYK